MQTEKQSKQPEADKQREHQDPESSREDTTRVVIALTYPDCPGGAATY